MRKNIIRMLYMMLTMFALASTSLFASDGLVKFVNRAEQFIVYPEDKDLFINFKNVMPGDTLTQYVVLENSEDNDFDFEMFLKVYPVDEVYTHLLSQLNLKIIANGRLIYDDVMTNTEVLEEYISVARLYKNTKSDLEIILEVPLDMSNESSAALGKIVWEFMVMERIEEPKVVDPPVIKPPVVKPPVVIPKVPPKEIPIVPPTKPPIVPPTIPKEKEIIPIVAPKPVDKPKVIKTGIQANYLGYIILLAGSGTVVLSKYFRKGDSD